MSTQITHNNKTNYPVKYGENIWIENFQIWHEIANEHIRNRQYH